MHATSRSPCILLTGATGFLGKVVLEELLRRRDEDDVGQIFVLIRADKGLTAHERFRKQVAPSRCFQNLPPECLEKVVVVEGNLEQINCGIVEDYLPILFEEITHVINCAACVSFDLPLMQAVKANVSTARNLLSLAKSCTQLRSLVTTSTAYVSPHRTGLITPQPAALAVQCTAEQLYQRILAGGVDEARILQESGYPNTYTLSKCLAEHVFLSHSSSIPRLKIVRPSIISCSLRHPFPGWIDSKAAVAGFIALIGSGYLRVVDGRKDAVLDVIPVDIVAQDVIREAGLAHSSPPPAYLDKELATNVVTAAGYENPIVHSVAGVERGLLVSLIAQRTTKYFQDLRAFPTKTTQAEKKTKTNTSTTFRAPKLTYLGPRTLSYHAHELLGHRLPLLALQIFFKCAGNRDMARKTYSLRRVLKKVNTVFPYYARRTFDFEVAPESQARGRREETEDLSGEVWGHGDAQRGREEYLDIILDGVRKNLLKM